MVALLVHPTVSFESEGVKPPTISASIFDYSLSEGAIAVYAYLCTAVRRMRINNIDQWIATPCTDRIAEKCFRGGRPDGKAPSLRKLVARATKELLAKGLITVGNRYELDERRGNIYILQPQLMRSNTDLRVIQQSDTDHETGGMRSNFVNQAIPGGSKDGGVRSDMDHSMKTRSSTDHEAGGARSGTDHLSRSDLGNLNNIYINLNTQDLDPERERLKELNPVLKEDPMWITSKNFAADSSIENAAAEFVISDESGAVMETGIVVADSPAGETESATATSFDPETFDWSTYSLPGDGGSDPDFWAYTVGIVEDFVQQNPGRVGDVNAYALGCIRRQGPQRYAVYQRRSLPVQAAVAQSGELTFTPAAPTMALEEANAVYREYWKDLKLSWQHPAVVAWIEAAQAWRPFALPAQLNTYTLPSWATARLVEDMAIAVQSRVRSGVRL